MIGQAQALMKMMTFIITAIDNPVKLIIPLKKLGTTHMSFDVDGDWTDTSPLQVLAILSTVLRERIFRRLVSHYQRHLRRCWVLNAYEDLSSASFDSSSFLIRLPFFCCSAPLT
jgi:hypothetical protein